MIAAIGVCAVLALAIYAVAYFVLDEHRAAPPSRARAALSRSQCSRRRSSIIASRYVGTRIERL